MFDCYLLLGQLEAATKELTELRDSEQGLRKLNKEQKQQLDELQEVVKESGARESGMNVKNKKARGKLEELEGELRSVTVLAEGLEAEKAQLKEALDTSARSMSQLVEEMKKSLR